MYPTGRYKGLGMAEEIDSTGAFQNTSTFVGPTLDMIGVDKSGYNFAANAYGPIVSNLTNQVSSLQNELAAKPDYYKFALLGAVALVAMAFLKR